MILKSDQRGAKLVLRYTVLRYTRGNDLYQISTMNIFFLGHDDLEVRSKMRMLGLLYTKFRSLKLFYLKNFLKKKKKSAKLSQNKP